MKIDIKTIAALAETVSGSIRFEIKEQVGKYWFTMKEQDSLVLDSIRFEDDAIVFVLHSTGEDREKAETEAAKAKTDETVRNWFSALPYNLRYDIETGKNPKVIREPATEAKPE